MQICVRKKTSQKSFLKSDLGTSWGPFGRFGKSFGKGLEALGVSWVVSGTLFFMLVFGMVLKSALGAVWLGFRFDFNGFWEDLGRVLEGFWEGLGRICAHSG